MSKSPITTTSLLPLPIRDTMSRYEPGQQHIIATPGDGEVPVVVLIQHGDEVVLQALEAIPHSDIFKGEVFVTHIINMVTG